MPNYYHEQLSLNDRRMIDVVLNDLKEPMPSQYADPSVAWTHAMIAAVGNLDRARLEANSTDPYIHTAYTIAEEAQRSLLNAIFGPKVGDMLYDCMMDTNESCVDQLRKLAEDFDNWRDHLTFDEAEALGFDGTRRDN